MRVYYIHLNGVQRGPYDEATLRGMNLSPSTPIWCQGMRNWGTISQVLPNYGSSYQPQQVNSFQSQQHQSYQAQQNNGYQTQQGYNQAYQQPGAQFIAPEQLSLWGYYKKCWSNYATFSGRARRTEFWSFALFNLLIALGISIFTSLLVFIVMLMLDDSGAGLLIALPTMAIATYIVSTVFMLATLIPGLAVASRRLHDTGRSFWWILLSLTGILMIIPIIGLLLGIAGPITLLVFYFMDSEPMTNQYGPNPKTGR